MGRIILFIALMAIGCKPPDSKTPEGAFARMAKCIDKADARCLYGSLDRDSRWSIQTIHHYLVEASELVNKSYPTDKKRTAFGTWYEEALSRDYAGVFDAYCGKRRCLEEVARGFGAVVNVKKTKSDTVVVKTTRGLSFEMFFAEDRWGITLFRDDLQKGKIRVLDRLNQVKKNVREFDEQRLAGGAKDVGLNVGQGE